MEQIVIFGDGSPQPNNIVLLYQEIFVIARYNDIIFEMYSISNYGRVYSWKTHGLRTQHVDSNGYLRVTLYKDKAYCPSIHRLVMCSFVPILYYKYYEINHIDYNRTNAYIFNLEWCTHDENVRHSINNYRTGDNHHSTVFTEAEVEIICKLLEEGKTYKEIINYFGYPIEDYRRYRDDIRAIVNKNTYTYISNKYNIIPGLNNKPLKYSLEFREKICQLLTECHTYQEILDILNIPFDERTAVREYIWNIISGKFDTLGYDIQPQISEKPNLFTDDQIVTICKCIANGILKTVDIFKYLNLDYMSYDAYTRHKYSNCIFNIKNKRTFQHISDLYF